VGVPRYRRLVPRDGVGIPYTVNDEGIDLDGSIFFGLNVDTAGRASESLYTPKKAIRT
jgi:hypothetical protein